MTAPYRLRDAFGDVPATIHLVGAVSAAGLLGQFPSAIRVWSLGTGSAAAYIVLSLVALLIMMEATDRRLREVSG